MSAETIMKIIFQHSRKLHYYLSRTATGEDGKIPVQEDKLLLFASNSNHKEQRLTTLTLITNKGTTQKYTTMIGGLINLKCMALNILKA